MASQWNIAVVTCLLFFIVMENTKPVFARKKVIKELVAKVSELEEKVECNPCAVLQEIGQRLDKIEEDIAALQQPACKFDFENGLDGWVKTDDAFNNQPTYGDNPTDRNRESANQQGDWWIGGYENRPSPSDEAGATQGDGPTGTLTSPFFTIMGGNITFLIGGGCDANVVRAELVIGDQVVESATGKCTETMHRETWDVTEFYGQRAQVRLVDDSSAHWGHINFDDMKGDITCGQN